MKQTFKYLLMVVITASLYQAAGATTISVRLIKDKSSRCLQQPVLKFLSNQENYTISAKQWYNGENDWEIFFEIETKTQPIALAQLEIEAKGIKIARAIIGRTDVPFKQIHNSITFQLVNDTTDGRHVQTSWQNPKGGPHIWFYHNWEARRNGKYLNVPYPAKALAASFNFVLACHEMLRLMGDMSGMNQKFYGEFILLTCESSAPRAHLDFPPHWHLEHWESGYNKEYGIDWRKKQFIIPHYYLDSAGNITHNKRSITQNYQPVKSAKNDYLPGDTCIWNDTEGNLIFKQVIKNGGLYFIKPNGEEWSLRPDQNNGSSESVWIYRGNSAVAKAKAVDNGETGETKLYIDYYDQGIKKNSWADAFRYDRFTGNQL
ncbi:hypothetical protein Mucpa_0694 [Mucilaginibacter paludis DSM 18603]|uniref:Uncharacterized protein n=2 Tax=Mucilaginibacter TaxID=423349 RepID=H1Y6C7_9SPHI|nr:hypothetical protein Mucpa_0694 [Mucilaginibacter paludis DSM 18603]